MDLDGKNIVVTGGASGIGKAMASRFIAEGAAQVVIADINGDVLEDVAQEIGATAITTDVSKESDVSILSGQLNQNTDISTCFATTRV